MPGIIVRDHEGNLFLIPGTVDGGTTPPTVRIDREITATPADSVAGEAPPAKGLLVHGYDAEAGESRRIPVGDQGIPVVVGNSVAVNGQVDVQIMGGLNQIGSTLDGGFSLATRAFTRSWADAMAAPVNLTDPPSDPALALVPVDIQVSVDEACMLTIRYSGGTILWQHFIGANEPIQITHRAFLLCEGGPQANERLTLETSAIVEVRANVTCVEVTP